MSNNDAVIKFLLNQLRQQLTNNPYKQQCEDLAHEVSSLNSQLRDMSELVDELLGTITLMNWDVEAYKVLRKGGYGSEQSGFRKEDVQECDHNWIIAPGLFIAEGHKDNVPGSRFCCECGAREWDDKEYKPKNDTQESCWIEWSGGDCPVPRGELVDVVYRDGKTLYRLPAAKINYTARDASGSFWRHDGEPNDIVRYRKAAHQ